MLNAKLCRRQARGNSLQEPVELRGQADLECLQGCSQCGLHGKLCKLLAVQRPLTRSVLQDLDLLKLLPDCPFLRCILSSATVIIV